MRALTILQPWAACICYLGKRVENRTWRPPADLIGERIAIHAGARFDSKGHDAMLQSELVVPTSTLSHLCWLALAAKGNPAVARGAVVATAIVDRVTEDGDSLWFCGPYGWVLREVEVLEEPVPCRGYQRVWTLPEDVERAVRESKLVGAGGIAS